MFQPNDENDNKNTQIKKIKESNIKKDKEPNIKEVNYDSILWLTGC